ncbi:hypothetical protein ACFL4T_13630 [candidate division KSB1 bacterium]
MKILLKTLFLPFVFVLCCSPSSPSGTYLYEITEVGGNPISEWIEAVEAHYMDLGLVKMDYPLEIEFEGLTPRQTTKLKGRVRFLKSGWFDIQRWYDDDTGFRVATFPSGSISFSSDTVFIDYSFRDLKITFESIKGGFYYFLDRQSIDILWDSAIPFSAVRKK